ncbi:hypothetical protein [Streptomyces sp. NPDC003077]|uniref:hypothetical protein n=1 Tax=Streptomyces sp. NPDC003077 TaxID=3154443 RepID=UPI0033AF2948
MSDDRRTNISNFLNKVVEASEDFLDGVLAKAGDVESDIRDTITKPFDNKEGRAGGSGGRRAARQGGGADRAAGEGAGDHDPEQGKQQGQDQQQGQAAEQGQAQGQEQGQGSGQGNGKDSGIDQLRKDLAALAERLQQFSAPGGQ